ncbi:hypothetical protein R1T16_12340 [Flavobacterium sp. DG1-102-2]|uniref:hypothetical protein n=1 Tax=Flavobacterium sp. DG1-102-2 TaxID=3081663 RepID=UPI002949E43D|nr:hypothetical protein [Flavobacterium sp. DG1-102-2]MDV6169216.1 hypothetical protein [Flavobacterium sp. DG1-102-2]
MKRKFAIFNLALMALVQLTIAYQSFHAFSHVHEPFAHHGELKKETKQISANDHEHEEDCSVCDFHFDYFIQPQQFCLRLDFPFSEIPYRATSVENNVAAFAGSLFSHRGPPLV